MRIRVKVYVGDDDVTQELTAFKEITLQLPSSGRLLPKLGKTIDGIIFDATWEHRKAVAKAAEKEAAE